MCGRTRVGPSCGLTGLSRSVTSGMTLEGQGRVPGPLGDKAGLWFLATETASPFPTLHSLALTDLSSALLAVRTLDCNVAPLDSTPWTPGLASLFAGRGC